MGIAAGQLATELVGSSLRVIGRYATSEAFVLERGFIYYPKTGTLTRNGKKVDSLRGSPERIHQILKDHINNDPSV